MSCWQKYSMRPAAPLSLARPRQLLTGPPTSGNGAQRVLLEHDVFRKPVPPFWHHAQADVIASRPAGLYKVGTATASVVPMIPLELLARIAAAATVFALIALWEVLAPRRPWSVGRRERWPHNLGILVIDALAVRILIPTAAVGAALFAAGNGWGLFHVAGLRLSVASLLGFLALDLDIYAQHVAFHKVPLLWRLHRMHHADLDMDVTTGLRFHPIEILLSMLLKIALVALIGVPALAVVAFEVVLNATSMFNHTNATMPPRLDRIVRLLVVTPDMHRVHHSIAARATHSHYGLHT